jgi:coenzyme PQQ synthesis protein D (PqqD)
MTELRLRSDQLYWREVDDEIVALEARGSKYLAANSSGVLLWRRLAQGATRDELVATLVEAHGIEPDVAATDVDQFVGQVRAAGLLAT